MIMSHLFSKKALDAAEESAKNFIKKMKKNNVPVETVLVFKQWCSEQEMESLTAVMNFVLHKPITTRE